MKSIDEINWIDEYKEKKEEEYEIWQKSKALAMSNGDPVSKETVIFLDNLQIDVWEGRISEDDFERKILNFYNS